MWVYKQHDQEQTFKHLHEALYELGHDAGYYRGMTMFPKDWTQPDAYAVAWFEGKEPSAFYLENEKGIWEEAPRVLVWNGDMISAVYWRKP